MRWCRTNATCRKSSGIRVWVSPTSRTICAVCWNAGWSVAAAKAASFGIVWRTGGSPISSVMQISYLPRQPTELMPAKAIRTNRRDLLQCPIGAPNLKQPSAHPQRMHPLSASYQFVHDAANGRCTDREGLLRISSYQPYDTPMSPISLGPSMTAIETHNAHSLAALAWDSAPRAFDPTYRSGAASRDVSNRLFAAAASFKSASKLSGGLPSSNIPLNVA